VAPETTSVPPTRAQEPTPPADAPPEPTTGTPPHVPASVQEAQRQAIAMMDDLAGVRTAMAMLAAAKGQGPAAATPPRPPNSGAARDQPSGVVSYEPDSLTGGAPSGTAGSAPSGGGGSGAVCALLLALAALAGGLSARLEIIPVRWRSVTIIALNERPG